MSAAKNKPNREALVALLERFNLSTDSFDKLRAESYEQQIARHSLEHLELLYTVLLTPGLTTEQQRKECPPWPPGTKLAGKLPSTTTLGEIATRLRTEGTLNNLGRVSTFMDKLRTRATALPVGQQSEVLDTIVNLVGEELLTAKLGGAAITSNLESLDRLLSNKALAIREKERQDKRDKFEFDAAQAALKHAAELKTISSNSKLTEAEKVNIARAKLFGALPKQT